jgi:TolB-like protein/Tfp pilus assembly protein PilF
MQRSAAPPGEAAIRAHLDIVLSSRAFSGSRRLQRFLRWTAERVLANEANYIKEYQLGVEVFERGQDFDPATDSIVRVEANRLRHKLREYYDDQGQQDDLRVEFPKGSYIPIFRSVRKEPAMRAGGLQRYLAAAGALIVLLVLGVILGARSFSRSKTIPIAESPPNSIAVLPFLSLGSGTDDAGLADGFAEELTNRLARIGELRVVARGSAFRFKGKPYDIRQIAGQLRVGTVLEGSLKKDHDHLEVTAELLSTRDGFYVWSDHYETSLQALDGTEDEIVMGILRSLKITPRGGLEAVLRHGPPPDAEAHRLYLEARFYWNQRTYEALQKAITLYEKAIEIEPAYALAEAGLAECYGVIAANGLADTRTVAEKGKLAANRAIKIDSSIAEAHAALGLIRSVADWNWPEAERAFQQAIALNPNYASAYQWRAHNFLWQGRFTEAHEAIQKALDLDSLSLVILSNQAEFAFFMRKYEEALNLYDRTLSVDPKFISATIERAMTLDMLTRYPEAAASYRRALDLTKEEASPLVGLAIMNAHMGSQAEARPILTQLEAGRNRLHVSQFQLATIYASLGDIDRGMSALEQAYNEHEAFLIALKVHPHLDPLRADPRFTTMQKAMRLD